jgi:hypothetical protein
MKLTVELDDELARRADEFSRKNSLDVPGLLADYLRYLIRESDEEVFGAWVASFMGPPRTTPAPTDEEARQMYRDYLAKKYS